MARLEKIYRINASAKALYEALTNQTIVSQWSGAPAMMSEDPGVAFSLWGGSIIGLNNEVSPNRLVQQWKEKSWKEFSNVQFEWKEESDVVELKLVHDDIPEGSFQNIKRGWDEHYMNPLITWIESNSL